MNRRVFFLNLQYQSANIFTTGGIEIYTYIHVYISEVVLKGLLDDRLLFLVFSTENRALLSALVFEDFVKFYLRNLYTQQGARIHDPKIRVACSTN